MPRPLAEGRSTPRYAALYALGVTVGSGVRLAAWLLPSELLGKLMERLLP